MDPKQTAPSRNNKVDTTTKNNEHDVFLADEVDALPKELRYSNFDLLCTVISILTYLFDLAMDVTVALYFYHLGVSHGVYHYWYFGLTITFILLPSLTMTGFSLRWYLMDADNLQLPPVPMWRWLVRLVVLMLQFAPVLRYIDSMRYGLKSRWAGIAERKLDPNSAERRKALQKRITYYTLMVYEDADATLLRLFECFMESAPQLVLQIYILIKDPHASKLLDKDSKLVDGDIDTDVIVKSTILVVSVISSLVSLAWSLVVYHRSLRYTYPEKNNLNCSGSIFQFLWHFLSITARVIALSLFASIYPVWIGPVCAAHWLIMTSWLVFQRTQACQTRCEEILFCVVLGAIYVFSFFNAKEERTRCKYLIYYMFCFCENTALISIWFLYANVNLRPGELNWYYYPGIVGHYLAFFGGIFFMVTYYTFFHPTGVEINFFCWQQSGGHRLPEGSNPNTFLERPNFLDLREDQVVSGSVDRELAVEGANGEAVTSLSFRPKSRLSVSSPVLDESDSPTPGQESQVVNETVEKQAIRRTQSVPTDRALTEVLVPGRRNLKMMARDHFERPPFF